METQDQRFNRALRLTGTVAVGASAVVFMLQGLGVMSSFERFLSFAGLTAVLAVFGILTGSRLKEDKAARTFLGLAAAATPVLFTQLGGMFYELLAQPVSANLPKAFLVTAPSMGFALAATAGTALLLVPVLYLGFGSFYRANAKQLVLLMLATSALILVPTRDAGICAMVLAIQSLMIGAYVLQAKKKPVGETESALAAFLPVIPSLIVIGRQWFYGNSDFMMAGVSLLVAVITLALIPFANVSERAKKPASTWGIFALATAWYFFARAVNYEFGLLPRQEALLTVYPQLIAFMLIPTNGRSGLADLRKAALPFSFFISVASIANSWHLTEAILCLGSGAFVTVLGATKRNRQVFLAGIVTAASGMAFFLNLSFHVFTIMPWLSLAAFGIVLIGAAAWLEANRSKLTGWRVKYDSYFSKTA